MAAKRLRPIHPGDILFHDFMQPLKLSSYKLSKELGVTAPVLERPIHPIPRPDLSDPLPT
jgi:antitoxin HigA-1